MALTLVLWREAKPERVSPFFTTTRAVEEERDFDATVFGFALVVVLATETVDFGFELVFVVVVRGLIDEVLELDFKVATSTGFDGVGAEVDTGVILLGGASFAARSVGSGSISMGVGALERRFHFDGLSAHAST
jgi:hypothetical protein